MLPDFSVSIFLLAFIGFGAGTVSGFSGVGGGFLVTPALIILGFPANLAVGVSLTWVAGNCVVGTFRHGRMGNVDLKLGLIVTVAATSGMEVGVRALNWAKDAGLATEAVLALTLVAPLSSGSYTLLESVRSRRLIEQGMSRPAGGTMPPSLPLGRLLQGISLPPVLRFPRSGVSLSLWTILSLGFGVGVVAGFIGVGGGFIMVPSLVYLLGVPSLVTVGTALFQTFFSASYGVVRHSLSSNVVVFASVILLLASSVGVQIGATATRYVRGFHALCAGDLHAAGRSRRLTQAGGCTVERGQRLERDGVANRGVWRHRVGGGDGALIALAGDEAPPRRPRPAVDGITSV